MTTKKRLAAYGMAASAAIGGGIGGLALGLGVAASPASVPTQLAASTGAAATQTALPGHPGGPGGAARVDRLAVASSALGMSAEELRTALEAGKSIAQVAADRKVDVQKVIDALVAASTAAIDKAVADGTLTQAQADERKANLAAHVKADVERTGLRGPGGPGKGGRGGGVHVDRLNIAAQALGVPATELRTALEGGKSIAQVAADRKVDVQKVIDALVAAENAAIDQAVTDGRLTSAQADEKKAGVAAHVKADVERVGLRGPGGPGGPGKGHGSPGGVRVDRLAAASSALGMPAEELRTALAAGKSMAQVAQERNVDVQKVIDALVAAENAAIDQAVTDGRLTSAQADEKKAGVAAHVKADVERVGLKGPGGPGGPGGGRRGPGGTPPAGAPSSGATRSAVIVS